MKIRSLHLAAYGPFTGVTIDLTAGETDFHMLLGPNEAGKSSALKAIRHMLFGIPAREPVNFLHRYTSLRIGARLVSSNGEEIEFLRRKGRVKTLRGHDDETVLDENALAPFLGGVGADLFERMFAIGHEELIQGGEEIISGKGSVGKALFAAGAGLIRLQTVQADLELAGGSLFKPGGSTPSINRAVQAIKAARRQQKDALLLPKTWKAHDRELSDAKKRMDAVKAGLGDCRQKKARLERFRDALPLIARKKEIDAALIAYQGLPDIADDFGDKRRDAEKELKIAHRDVSRLRETIDILGREKEALPDHRTLLDHAAAIESLQQELGGYRKAQKDRPGLEGRMRTLQQQAADMLTEIGADISAGTTGKPALPPSAVSEIQELGKEYERLTARQDSAAEQQRKRHRRLRRLSDQRGAMPAAVDVSVLENALQSALEAGPIEKQLAEMASANLAYEDDLKRAINRQTFWQGTLEDIDELPLPSQATVDRFDAGFDAMERTLEKHREAMAATEEEIAQTQARIQAIDLTHEVPTETDLKAARQQRDRGWELIRRNLEGRAVSAEVSRDIVRHVDDASDLTDAFEKSMHRADHISDRLRREADQVSKKGLLEAGKEKLQTALADIAATLKKDQARHLELEARWHNVWAPIDVVPLTPKEMRFWISEMLVLRERLADLRFQKRQAQTLVEQLAVLRTGLLVAFKTMGAPQDENQALFDLIRTAQARINEQKDLESRIASADSELRRLKADQEEGDAAVAELDVALSRWTTRWTASVGNVGIRADATPTAALAVIERIRDVQSKTAEADVLRKRIQGIDRDAAAFMNQVRALVDTFAVDLDSEPGDRAAELLYSRLTRARRDASRHTGLVERLESSQKELESAERRLFECQAAMEALCKQARCTDAGTLAETERRALERKSLVGELGDLEWQLRRLSAGATIEAFVEDASSLDADGIEPELRTLDEAVDALEKERSALDRKIGALQAGIDRMDGRSEAALHAEDAERLLAGLESDVERYARLKIAAAILSRTVEQYREKHQGPLISRASELFARMTLGAFSRLRADYDGRGQPVLVGVRADGKAQVHVEGMSDGTADQLYLALRLASLEQYLAHNEPLPFVVDDILLRFDDARALATLDVLAGLSEKTQVLFFTHHQHLVALAENSGDMGLAFNLHRLQPG